jgi:16S rRNA (cytidine1402-2'-O)-methyltransferase
MIVLARELTKLHEDVWRGTLSEAVQHSSNVEPRGEYALVLAPYVSDTMDVSDADILSELAQRTSRGLSKRDAIDEVTAALGVPRKRVYALAVSS